MPRRGQDSRAADIGHDGPVTEFLPPKPSWLSEPSPVERLRHCWMTADEHGGLPALLLEWRETRTAGKGES